MSVQPRMWLPGQREWGVVLDVEPTDKSYVTEDGRVFQDSTITVSVEAAAQMHAGYMCARCLEPLQSVGAFPERCPFCSFEVAKYQRQLLERQYQEVEMLPAGTPFEREREAMERELFRPKPKGTMAIPKSKRRS